MNAVELPPMGNPFIVMYSRICNSPLPANEELADERLSLRRHIGELDIVWQRHFKKCDARRSEDLLAERDALAMEGKSLLQKIETQQRSGGFHSSGQAPLQGNLKRAQEKLEQFEPINRTIASFEEIAENEAQKAELQKAVNEARQAIRENHQSILMGGEQANDLRRRYGEIEDRQEAIIAELEQLKLPPDQRRRRSSVVWQDGDSTFMAQMP
jgi:DNA repair exonuclease SbcCD ATPase subunit